MARTAITVTTVSRTGIADPTEETADVANGMSLENNVGVAILHVRNSGAVSRTITFVTPGTVDGLAVADLVITVDAGAGKWVGPFDSSVYNTSGNVLVDPSHTDLKLYALAYDTD